MLAMLCRHFAFLSTLCAKGFNVKAQVSSAAVGLLVGYIFKAFGSLAGLLRPKYWKLCGHWYRYGLGFYPNSGVRPLHISRVFIVPIPPLTLVFSFSKSYSYLGTLRIAGNNMYIATRGIFHSERMSAVYTEPVVINNATRLLGVKSCITKRGEPAANMEMLTKVPVDEHELRSVLDTYNGFIVIEDAVTIIADYER